MCCSFDNWGQGSLKVSLDVEGPVSVGLLTDGLNELFWVWCTYVKQGDREVCWRVRSARHAVVVGCVLVACCCTRLSLFLVSYVTV
jgi:hypothetical protein